MVSVLLCSALKTLDEIFLCWISPGNKICIDCELLLFLFCLMDTNGFGGVFKLIRLADS